MPPPPPPNSTPPLPLKSRHTRSNHCWHDISGSWATSGSLTYPVLLSGSTAGAWPSQSDLAWALLPPCRAFPATPGLLLGQCSLCRRVWPGTIVEAVMPEERRVCECVLLAWRLCVYVFETALLSGSPTTGLPAECLAHRLYIADLAWLAINPVGGHSVVKAEAWFLGCPFWQQLWARTAMDRQQDSA